MPSLVRIQPPQPIKQLQQYFQMFSPGKTEVAGSSPVPGCVRGNSIGRVRKNKKTALLHIKFHSYNNLIKIKNYDIIYIESEREITYQFLSFEYV